MSEHAPPHYDGCQGCRVAAEALALRNPDDPHVAWLHNTIGDPP